MKSQKWSGLNDIREHFVSDSKSIRRAGAIVYAAGSEIFRDDSDRHICVIGRTGCGKTEGCSLNFLMDVLQHDESAVSIDAKGDFKHRLASAVPAHYQVFHIDLRTPRWSDTSMNILAYPFRLFSSGRADDADDAAKMVKNLFKGLCPRPSYADYFWSDAASNTLRALTMALFAFAEEIGKPETVNIESLLRMFSQLEAAPVELAGKERGAGLERLSIRTLGRQFFDLLPSHTIARKLLATYACAPQDTRGSIYAEAANAMEPFMMSGGLCRLMMQDTCLSRLDVNKPFWLNIIVPDEDSSCDVLAGVCVQQICSFLIRAADRMGGSLQRRVNVLIEELGSVGEAIPNLPHLMVAGRSRKLRLMLVLQSYSQLDEIYGKAKAESIRASVGLTYAFSTSDFNTLESWSRLCGERITDVKGQLLKERLITPAQILAMQVGQALIIADGKYKFTARLPMFHELQVQNKTYTPKKTETGQENRIVATDLRAMVAYMLQKKEAEENKMNKIYSREDIRGLINRIDAQIAKLEGSMNEEDDDEEE